MHCHYLNQVTNCCLITVALCLYYVSYRRSLRKSCILDYFCSRRTTNSDKKQHSDFESVMLLTWTITNCLGLGHETMVSAVCVTIFLWICYMAGLLRGAFVSWWYLPRIWPPVTDMQYYYHARYPTDDWHLAYMFSLVYFPSKCVWKACLPILLAHGEIPASGSRPPSRWLPLHEKYKIEQGRPSIWRMGLPALLGGNLGCLIV